VVLAPTVGGTLSGTLTLTDNSLNESGASQQVQLSGSAGQLSTTALTANPSSAVFGQSLTLTATVSTTQFNNAAPSGTVTFSAGSTQVGQSTLTAVSNTTSQALLTLNANLLAVGTTSIQASYSGDSNYLASSGTLSFTVAAYGNVAAIAALSGTPQASALQTTFAAPLVVQLTDLYNNPVPLSGTTVTFTVPTSGASATLSASTAATDSNGQASELRSPMALPATTG